uniref:Uncharacterized protein n=1 Tax=Arundo donax TaxID=35708 RepID=A0A0A9EXG8_ARUDO
MFVCNRTKNVLSSICCAELACSVKLYSFLLQHYLVLCQSTVTFFAQLSFCCPKEITCILHHFTVNTPFLDGCLLPASVLIRIHYDSLVFK